MVSNSLAKPSRLTMVPSERGLSMKSWRSNSMMKFDFIVSQQENHIFEF